MNDSKTASASTLVVGLLATVLSATSAVNSVWAAGLDGQEKRPNVVILVADDLGWADVSFHGQQIATPNLDRLVAQGTELSRFYVCPVCSPTRAGLMTGRYPIRFGLMRAVVPPWRKGGLDTSEVTLADVLGQAGYAHRGVFGKWHLGHSDIRYHPLRRGFTQFVGHYNGAIDYFTHEREGQVDWHHDYLPHQDAGYSTDLIADAAADFIRAHAHDASPFLCYVPFNAPHSPLQAKEEDLQKYQHLADVPRSPGKKGQTKKKRTSGPSPRQKLAAMISSLDQGVGRILAALDTQQISDQTLVWFFSDNGGVGVGDNRPLRGQKAMVYEGGVRVPAAVRWPGKIPAGRIADAPLAYIDVLPTLMGLLGHQPPGGKPLDGIDASAYLLAQAPPAQRDLYEYIGQGGEDQEQIAVIEPSWKLVVIGRKIIDGTMPRAQREVHLFRIDQDPLETDDLAEQFPQEVERMWKKLVAFRALQPPDGVPPYGERADPFIPQPNWRIPGAPE